MTEKSRGSNTSSANPSADRPDTNTSSERVRPTNPAEAETATAILPFQTTELNALNEVPLGKEEDRDDRENRNHRSGHEQVEGIGILALEEPQPQRNRKVFDAAQIDVRFKKGVPCPPEGENSDSCQRRLAQGQHHIPQDLQCIGAINARRIFQFQRDTHKKLAQQKDQKRIAKKGANKQRPVGVNHSERLKNLVSRNEQHRERHHH